MSEDLPFDIGFSRPAWTEIAAGDEEPDRWRATAHQDVDDHHRPGEGVPCYRLVFKTMRVALRGAHLEWPNLRVRFASGAVRTGGFRIDDSLPSRQSDSPILPEYARWVPDGSAEVVRETRRIDPTIRGWERSFEDVFFVELLLDVDAEPEEIVAKGRRGLASMLTIVELTLGSRLIAAILAEEAGERFEDGHFARRISTPGFRWEAQLDYRLVDNTTLTKWAWTVVDPFEALEEPARRRFSLASYWYQSAVAAEPATAFVLCWLVAEVLAMKSTKSQELTSRLTDLQPEEAALWDAVVRKLVRRRADLLHGRSSDITDVECTAARALARLLLLAELNVELGPPLEEFASAGAKLIESA